MPVPPEVETRHRQDFMWSLVPRLISPCSDLGAAQARRLRRFRSPRSTSATEVHIVHRAKHRVSQPVQAGRHALEARCSLQRRGLPR